MKVAARAFSLIEALIVICIIGVLAALFWYGVQKYREEQTMGTIEDRCAKACHPFVVVACLPEEKIVVCQALEGKKVVDLQ